MRHSKNSADVIIHMFHWLTCAKHALGLFRGSSRHVLCAKLVLPPLYEPDRSSSYLGGPGLEATPLDRIDLRPSTGWLLNKPYSDDTEQSCPNLRGSAPRVRLKCGKTASLSSAQANITLKTKQAVLLRINTNLPTQPKHISHLFSPYRPRS